MTSTDFALAQQRLEARRRQREVEHQARISEHTSHANATLQYLPSSLHSSGRFLLRFWEQVGGREGTGPAFRVGQVDAELLDEELLSLLQGQAGDALKYYGAHVRDEWSPEILLILRAILFKLTIWDHNTSYGAALQGLRYTDARETGSHSPPPTVWQKSLYGLVTVAGRYTWTKWENWLLDREASYDEPMPNVRQSSRITSFIATAHSSMAFVSFLVFLVNGKYRTLLDRLLKLRLAPTSSRISREVSFEYLNRQLVWHAFTEFLLFILPLVGISRWRRWLSRAWRKARSVFRSSAAEQESEGLKDGGPLSFLPERTCAICYQDQNPTAATGESEMMAATATSSGIIGSAQTDITNPYETLPCACIYCYVCIAQRLEAEEGEGWTCLRCGELAKECKPWSGDVLEEVSRPSSGKSSLCRAMLYAIRSDRLLLAHGGHERDASATSNTLQASP
ncbi:peroxisomal biogenesis factor 2 [Viridothelium virens]|uniref:Peroxisomal biogenesis factor 2 n=1 Tax=Viridothelium virens TaxID=1048519 RepID=A0A6A6GX11_VIRVR|nr:peroxisomal biogenesis factor 2 [Viridothelium virens]